MPEPRLPPWPAATIDYQPWTVAERPLPVARTLSGLVGHALAAIRALEGFWAVFGRCGRWSRLYACRGLWMGICSWWPAE